ncbi:MAG: archease, partial [bacterium]|nr:archease [bacterium]
NALAPGSQQAQVSRYPIEFNGDSCENLLVKFLGELVFLLQSEFKITRDISFDAVEETFLKAVLLTVPCNLEPDLEIKAVTYHNLIVRSCDGIKSTEIVFDI